MSITFGSKDSFAMQIGDASWPSCTVEVWAAGQNLSSFDSSAYLPSFLNSLTCELCYLKEQLNFLAFEDCFRELSVEDAFRWLESQERPEVWDKLRILDWGPTTDDYLCFLLPIRRKLYLACKGNESEIIHAVQILPYDLITVLSATLAELSKFNPYASPEIAQSNRLSDEK
ncbi:hypothetical protein MJ904_22380 [Massilia sp. MB5]|uniref:hypothetical protein n=1 Tax=Massilia sp. MB5 TaxID=2919578 RepID=UPI001F0F10FB|nr:hypothetical protein [Massilia sp. MB5]UMR29757.1 hypothetical protein MJ904_22380 [Massilia sp. MB5]